MYRSAFLLKSHMTDSSAKGERVKWSSACRLYFDERNFYQENSKSPSPKTTSRSENRSATSWNPRCLFRFFCNVIPWWSSFSASHRGVRHYDLQKNRSRDERKTKQQTFLGAARLQLSQTNVNGHKKALVNISTCAGRLPINFSFTCA